jgi:hypothetical protein
MAPRSKPKKAKLPSLTAKQEVARKMLERHAAALRSEIKAIEATARSNPAARVDIRLKDYVASRIENFIADTMSADPSTIGAALAAAFEVNRPRGNPGSKGGRPGKHFDLAWKALLLHMAGYSWKEIARKLEFTGGGNDTGRALKEIVDREFAALKKRWDAETAPEPRVPDQRTDEETEAELHRISKAAFLAERPRGK